MQKFWIRGYDNQEYGPVDLPTLRRWCAERRVVADTPIREEFGLWKPAQEFLELSDLMGTWPSIVPPPVWDARWFGGIASVIWAFATGWGLLRKNWQTIVPAWFLVVVFVVSSGMFGPGGVILTLLASGPLYTGLARVLLGAARGSAVFFDVVYGFRRFFPSAPVHWLRQVFLYFCVFAAAPLYQESLQSLMEIVRQGKIPTQEELNMPGLVPFVLAIVGSYVVSHAFFWWADLSLAWSERAGMLESLKDCVVVWVRSALPALLFFVSYVGGFVVSMPFAMIPMLLLGPWYCLSVALWYYSWKTFYIKERRSSEVTR